MFVQREARRNVQSKTFQRSSASNLRPARPGTCGDAPLSSRDSASLSLQVQGICCPLQQRPSSGKMTHKGTSQSRREGDGRLMLLNSFKGNLESRSLPVWRTRTGSRPEITPDGRTAAMGHWKDPTETPTTSSNNETQDCQGQPGATKVSNLHLYLPSSLCEDEEQEAEEMGTSADDSIYQDVEVKINLLNPSNIRKDKAPHSSTQDPSS